MAWTDSDDKDKPGGTLAPDKLRRAGDAGTPFGDLVDAPAAGDFGGAAAAGAAAGAALPEVVVLLGMAVKTGDGDTTADTADSTGADVDVDVEAGVGAAWPPTEGLGTT